MERRIRDDVIRAARQAEVGGIGLHHNDARPEPLPKHARACWVGFDRDDARTRVDQRGRDRAGTGADVEDDGAGREPSLSDEPPRPLGVELVPAPTPS